MVELVAAVEPATVGDAEAGVATGAATLPSGGTMVSGKSATGDNVALGVVTGMEVPGMGDTVGAGIWPLIIGNVVGGPTSGSIGSDVAGSLGVSGSVVSSRIRAEVAHPRVMASKKRQIVVLSTVLEVYNTTLAILGFVRRNAKDADETCVGDGGECSSP